jgi:hypothetical protein
MTTTPSDVDDGRGSAKTGARNWPSGRWQVLLAVRRGGGWDRPEAARPPGSLVAVGGAGGFNAVQKLLTNPASGTASGIGSCLS